MPSSISTIAAAALLSLLVATDARAELREFRFYEENDSWLNPPGHKTDRYYTQGLKLEWIYGPRHGDVEFLPGITHANWCSLLCGKGERPAGFESGHAFGQNMYTPEDIGFAGPQPNDRPWAGFLYGSRIARATYRDEALNAERQDRIEVSVGIVGPASLAKEVQTVFHELVGADRPRGWDNQLRNEPVLQLRYDTAVRWGTRNADVIPRVQANLGNALTSLEADVTGRLGWNLSGFGVPTIRPSPPPPPPTFAMNRPANALARPGWRPTGNLFLRAGIKAVAHNITLDGNSFADNDIRIRRKVLVPELAAGVEVKLVRKLWISYQFVHRGSEFERRNGRDAPAQKFGAVTIAWR